VLSNRDVVAVSGLASSCTECKCLDQTVIVVAEAYLYVYIEHIIISIGIIVLMTPDQAIPLPPSLSK